MNTTTRYSIAMLAIDTLKKIISGIGEAISFLNMLDAYNKLRDKAADLRVQLKKYKADIAPDRRENSIGQRSGSTGRGSLGLCERVFESG